MQVKWQADITFVEWYAGWGKGEVRMKDTKTQQGRKKDLLDECGFPGVCEWRV